MSDEEIPFLAPDSRESWERKNKKSKGVTGWCSCYLVLKQPVAKAVTMCLGVFGVAALVSWMVYVLYQYFCEYRVLIVQYIDGEIQRRYAATA